MNSDCDENETTHLNNHHNSPDVCTTTSENQPLLPASSSSTIMELSDNHQFTPWNTSMTDDVDYVDVIKQAERAIEAGILPIRIAAGSSGSYFVRNLEGVCFSFINIYNIFILIANYWSI